MEKQNKCEHIWVDAKKEIVEFPWKRYVDIRVCLKCPAVRGDKKRRESWK